MRKGCLTPIAAPACRPSKCFGEYLALNKSVQIVDIENYDIDMACEFLDKAFDFSHHKSKPMIPRQPGATKQLKP